CGVLAITPGLTAPALTRVTGVMRGGSPLGGTARLHLPGVGAYLSPLLIVVALAVLVAGIAAAGAVMGRPRRRAAAWGCGDGPQTARTEYTATSFAEPLQRVFDDVLRPEHDIEVSHFRESAYLVERVRFQLRVPDRIETNLYTPLLSAGRKIGRAARVLANGSVHRYLAYGLVSLLIVLVVGVSR
ncbi:MAG: proton-conducting transporter membrane subunit, partial [Actinomadura sp.]